MRKIRIITGKVSAVAGLSTIYTGDDRYYNNVFVGTGNEENKNGRYKPGLED